MAPNIVTRETLLIRFLSELPPMAHNELKLAVNAFVTSFEAKRASVYGRDEMYQTYLKLADQILNYAIKEGEILY